MTNRNGLERAFAGLPAHLLRRIEVFATPCRFVAKEIVFRTGDQPDGLLIVLDGQIRVSREARNHVELLHTETVGGLLGEIPVFGKVAFPATAVAIEATRCAKGCQSPPSKRCCTTLPSSHSSRSHDWPRERTAFFGGLTNSRR